MARQKITPDPTCLLEAHDVTMKFTRYDVGVNSLKELIVRAFRRDLRREKFTCLENVSFKIRQGEAVAVIGRNGVGKSTLLKIVSGILKPTSGWAHCNGRISPLLQLGAGFDGNATGIEKPEILAFAELGDFIHTPVKAYSSGMLARLGFSIAITMEAEIMLIDEILAVGDIAFQKKCYDRLAELRKKGLTFLIVSHGNSVRNLCDRAIWIERGHVIADGPAGEIFDRYAQAMMHPEQNA